MPSFDASPRKVEAHDEQTRLSTPISKIMRTSVISVDRSLSLSELVLLLVDHGISGVPVVDPSGRPIGVVSKTDLLHESYEDADMGQDTDPFIYSATATVGQVMNSPAVTLPSEASVADAARLMVIENVHRIPVVSESGQVIGIVGALDVLRWITFGPSPVPSSQLVRRK